MHEDGRMPSRVVKVLVVLTGFATVGAYASMLLLSTTQDRPDHLDVEPVKGVAAAACTELRTAVDALPPLAPTASAADRRVRVEEQGRLVGRLVEQVRAVGPEALARDVPVQEWLGDWATLGSVRQAWAEAGATGPVPVPVAEGRPLADRMGRVGVASCRVPTALTTAP